MGKKLEDYQLSLKLAVEALMGCGKLTAGPLIGCAVAAVESATSDLHAFLLTQ